MPKTPRVTREIVLGNETIPYVLLQSNRSRYLRMSMSLTGGLVVTLPRYGGEYIIESFLRQKAAWILKHTRRMKRLDRKTILKLAPGEYEKNKKIFHTVIAERVEFFNSLYKFRYNRISIRNQTSLWGSCTRSGNLQFNYKLSHLTDEAIDYVVVHELCHLKEPNHSVRFWNLVAKTVPNHKAIRKLLRQYVMSEG